MSKVISFKVPDETYYRLKEEKETFREILTPLVEDYLKDKQKPGIQSRIRAEKPKTRGDRYHKTREAVDDLLRRLNQFNDDEGMSE